MSMPVTNPLRIGLRQERVVPPQCLVIFGAVFSHILADLIASYLDPHIRSMILGIVIGGLLPLAFIPFLEILIKKKNKHHIVTGDHEDKKKI